VITVAADAEQEPAGTARAAAQATVARSPSGEAGPARAHARYSLPFRAALLALMAVLLYAAYLGQARSLGADSDGASNVLQAWDMLHGNPLLHGWWLSDVSFYTTELPEYMLVELIRGMNAGVIAAAAAATYTLLVLLAALLAKGAATGAEGLVRAAIAGGIMLAPGAPADAGTLLSSPDHVGTMVPLLLIWLVIDRLGDRWYLPWLVGILLTWVEIADQIAVYVGAIPVIVISAIRLYQRRESWRTDAGLLAAAALSAVAAHGAVALVRRAGGYAMASAHTSFTTSAQMPHNLWLTVESVLALFGADFFGLRLGAGAAVALLHLAGLGLAVWACCIGARRLLSAAERLVPMLVVAILISLAAYMFSTEAVDLSSARELVAVLPFGAVLAGRLLPGRQATTALLPALGLVAVCYAGVLGCYATRPAQPPPTQAVASWLMRDHLTDGIGDYWAANITTVATGGQVRVRGVAVSCGRFAPYVWETRMPWYEPPSTARFLVLGLSAVAGQDGTASQAVAQFGAPLRTARIGAYEVLVWNHNLLPAVTGGSRHGCGAAWQR
jgi:hypothetical protein